MRIIDRLTGGAVHQGHLEPSGIIRTIEVTQEVQRSIADCHLRFVIDRNASQQCADLMREQPEIFAIERTLLRFPAERCWIEFYDDRGPSAVREGQATLRHGLLVNTDRGGRSGSLCTFIEQCDGSVIMNPGSLEFDLDGGVATDGRTTFRIRNADLPGLDAVLEQTAFRPEREWIDRYPAPDDRAYFLQQQAGYLWYALPYGLCFSALLNTKSVLHERSSDLDRLNRARVRRGRQPLLDHVEVSFRLGARYEHSERGDGVASRRAPRLHIVRGHPVQRAGKTFWRTTHIRGEGEQVTGSRTVTVRSGRQSG